LDPGVRGAEVETAEAVDKGPDVIFRTGVIRLELDPAGDIFVEDEWRDWGGFAQLSG
jgi:hypothetical protein